MTVFFSLPFTTCQRLCGRESCKLRVEKKGQKWEKRRGKREEGRRRVIWSCCDSAVKVFFFFPFGFPTKNWCKPRKPAAGRGFCPSKTETADEVQYRYRYRTRMDLAKRHTYSLKYKYLEPKNLSKIYFIRFQCRIHFLYPELKRNLAFSHQLSPIDDWVLCRIP